jgi:M6 family metalloprotease-like protein
MLEPSPFAANQQGPIDRRNVQDFYLVNSCGLFTYKVVGIVGPLSLASSVSQMPLNLRRPKIVDSVRDAGLFDFTPYNYPQEAYAANATLDSNKQQLSVLIIDSGAAFGAQTGGWIAECWGSSSLNVLAHELCHQLGATDLYGPSNLNANLSLMSANDGTVLGRSSWHLDPWHKLRLGWAEPRLIEMRENLNPIRLVAPEAQDRSGTVILFDPARPLNEYFILEFRNASERAGQTPAPGLTTGGYDQNFPGTAGVVIWHVVTSGTNFDAQINLPGPQNTTVAWERVYADGRVVGTFNQLLPSYYSQPYQDFQMGGNTPWGGGSVSPPLRWYDGTQAAVRIAVIDFPPSSDVAEIVLLDSSREVDSSNFWPSANSSQNLIVSTWGQRGNFELLVAINGKLAHFWRDNNLLATPWHGPVPVTSSSIPSTSAPAQQALIHASPAAISLIQSNFRSPGDLEAVVRMHPSIGSDFLALVVRTDTGWHGPTGIMLAGNLINKVTANPALVQSTFGSQGNFEMLVGSGTQLLHYWRNNDAIGRPWNGPFSVHDWKAATVPGSPVASISQQPIYISLLQIRGGDLAAVVVLETLTGERSIHYVERNGATWTTSPVKGDDGKTITGIMGGPSMIQSYYGQRGNYEMLVPMGKRVVHYWRDNDAAGRPWHGPYTALDYSSATSGTAIISAFPQAVALVQSAMSPMGSLEAVVRVAPVAGDEFLVTLVRSGTNWQVKNLIADGKRVDKVSAL